jgi:hypothetical protein
MYNNFAVRNNDFAVPFVYLNVNGVNNLLYQEYSLSTGTSTLINHGGVTVYVRDTANLHFSITVDSSFAIVIYVSMSTELYVDIFPPFSYYGDGPAKIRPNARSSSYGHFTLGDSPLDPIT